MKKTVEIIFDSDLKKPSIARYSIIKQRLIRNGNKEGHVYSSSCFLVLFLMSDELLEIVDKDGKSLGVAPRSSIHGNPSLLHKVIHVLVFNSAGELLLQKRSMSKDVAPGQWDTSVGGHVSPAEDTYSAARREMMEELGVDTAEIIFLYSYIHSNAYESELVFSHSCIHNGPFPFNTDEIDSVKFWEIEEIKKSYGSGVLSEYFESEMTKYLSCCSKGAA